MSEFTQWNPNERLMVIANALRGTTDFLNKARLPESVPGIGGLGFGDITTGKSGDLFKSMAYGEPILNHSANEGMFKDPGAVMDTAMLPGIGTLASVLRKGGVKAAQTGIDAGRRAAIGNLGKGAAVAGAAAITPLALVDALRAVPKGLGKELVPAISKAVVKRMTAPELALATKQLQNFMDHGLERELTHELVSPELISKAHTVAANAKELEGLSKYANLSELDPLGYHAYLADYDKAAKKYFPIVDAIPDAEIQRVLKLGPENLPKQYAEQGITPEMIAGRRFHQFEGQPNEFMQKWQDFSDTLINHANGTP